MNNIAVVKAYDEAQLVVQVVACRTKGLDDTDVANDAEWVSVLIKRGPRLSAERFAAVPRTYVHRDAMRLAAPDQEAPVWRFDAYGQFVRSATLRVLTMLVEDFASKLP